MTALRSGGALTLAGGSTSAPPDLSAALLPQAALTPVRLEPACTVIGAARVDGGVSYVDTEPRRGTAPSVVPSSLTAMSKPPSPASSGIAPAVTFQVDGGSETASMVASRVCRRAWARTQMQLELEVWPA